MTVVLSTNVTSPLGMTTEDNFTAIKAGKTALRRYSGHSAVKEPFTAALFSQEQTECLAGSELTRFESLVTHSVRQALSLTRVKTDSPRTVLILATTKCNVEELQAGDGANADSLSPGGTADKLAERLGFTTGAVTVSSACVSGVAAQILADRLIGSGACDVAVVCGADCISDFILSGFLSFKALDPGECRPFDIDRCGLNLGEAAATMIFASHDYALKEGLVSPGKPVWRIAGSGLTNDAYNLSAPLPSGDGLRRAMEKALEGFDKEELAEISAHGTATMFNDQMESLAIEKSGLSGVPVTALKSIFGHTLGAAGVLETAITMRALDDGKIFPVRGFAEIGVSGRISVCDKLSVTEHRSFLKTISGFGGCNGAILLSRESCRPKEEHNAYAAGASVCSEPELKVIHSVQVTQSSLNVDGEDIGLESHGAALLTEIYGKYSGDWPQFFKADAFGRLVMAACGLLLRDDSYGNTAIAIFNRTASAVADRRFLHTVSGEDGFFPSPSAFLYTLPNIALGEVAVKFGITMETSLFILGEKDEAVADRITRTVFRSSGADFLIAGWADCPEENVFEADLKLLHQ